MEKLSIKEVLSAVNGIPQLPITDYRLPITGVAVDSRKVKEGDLFVAIKGEKVDGHSFVDEAIKKGAIAALVEKSSVIGHRSSVIEVEDTVKALGDLARYYRDKFKIHMIGITGSNGKTSTKELTARCLESKYSVLKSEGSYNSLTGVPLTLFNLSRAHEFCVLEIGTNQMGEIARLSSIANPEIATITNIGPTHLEGFKTMKEVLKEKLKLLDNAEIAVLNADDPLLRETRDDKLAWERREMRVFKFGIKNKCDLKAEIIKAGQYGTEFSVSQLATHNSQPTTRNSQLSTHFNLPLLGVYQVYNALAALSISVQFGLKLEELSGILREVQPLNHREEILEIGGVRIIDSTYNANPVSMKLAIEEFCGGEELRSGPSRSSSPYGKRKIVVLGDMLELGEKAYEYHREIGIFLNEQQMDVVIAVGNLAKGYTERDERREMREERKTEKYYFEEVGEAADFLKGFLKAGDEVLIKGSRAMQMEKIIELMSCEL